MPDLRGPSYFREPLAAIQFVESLRWGDSLQCPHCEVAGKCFLCSPETDSSGRQTHAPIWKCGACRRKFSSLSGTVFERTRIPLEKWLLGIQKICAQPTGLSALELGRELAVSRRTAYALHKKVSFAIQQAPLHSKWKKAVRAITISKRSLRRAARASLESANSPESVPTGGHPSGGPKVRRLTLWPLPFEEAIAALVAVRPHRF